MPVILPTLPDPTDVVAQGSYLQPAPSIATAIDSDVGGTNTELPFGVDLAFSQMVEEGPENFWPDPPVPACLPVRSSLQTAQPFQNAVICTPTGAIIDVLERGNVLLGQPFMSTTLWQIIGTTRDAAGVALPSCRVIVLAQGYLAVGAQANAVIAETISSSVDGTFTINVPGNGDYGLIAYKPGDPPTVAGITLFNLIATSPG